MTASLRAGSGTRRDPATHETPRGVRLATKRRGRQVRATTARVSAAGRPVRSAMLRVPFVVAIIAVLGGGVGGVLYLNTKIDESGIRTEQARETSADLTLQIESLNRSIAELGATPRLAQEARKLGLVPAGDAAILVIDESGKSTVVGDPRPVRGGGAQTGGGH